MSNFPIFHGIALADNSWIENLHVERLVADPVPLAAGRVWYNTTDKAFRFSHLNASGAVIVRTFQDAESAQAALSALQTDLTAEVTRAQSAEAALDAKIDATKAELLGGIPPATLDTITELAAALRDNPDIVNVIETKIGTDIAAAKAELKGTVTEAMDTLGEIETALTQEVSDRTAAVAAEAAARTAGDAALDTRLTTIEAQSNGKIGDLTSLHTTEKGTLVGAINEVKDGLVSEITRAQSAEASIRSDYNAKRFTFASASGATEHTIAHNLGSQFVDISVWVQRPDGKFRNDVVSVEEVDTNTLKVYLAVSSQVKVTVTSMATL